MNAKKVALGVALSLYGVSAASALEPEQEAGKVFLYQPKSVNATSAISLPSWKVINNAFSNWGNVGGAYDCAEWAPPVDFVNFGETFTQSRDCSINQSRTRTDTLYSERLKQTRTEGPFDESQVIGVQEAKEVVGVYRNWVATEPVFSAWTTFKTEGTGLWSPEVQGQDETFAQSRTQVLYQRRYEQQMEVDTVTGQLRNFGEATVEEKTLGGTESRNIVVTSTGWAGSGAPYDCGDFSPEASEQRSTYTQSANCTLPTYRVRYYTVESESKSFSSDIVSGTQPTESVRTVDVARTDTGFSKQNIGEWSPEPTDETASFIQYQPYDNVNIASFYHKIKGDTVHSFEDITSLQQSNNRKVDVGFTGWVSTGVGLCGDWLPAPNTVAYNELYTQTRSCEEPQSRERVYKVGSEQIGSATETQVATVEKTQPAQGLGRWEAYASTFTNYEDVGEPYGHSNYLPEANNQTSNFRQYRDYKQDIARYEQQREQDVIGGAVRNVGEPIAHPVAIDKREERLVTVTGTAWEVVGEPISCTEITPSFGEQKSNYTQSQTCDNNEQRTLTYDIGGSAVQSKVVSDYKFWLVSVSGVTGRSEGFDYLQWSPGIDGRWSNFNQGQYYSSNQYTVTTHRINGAVVFENEFITHTYEGDRYRSRYVLVTNSGGWVDTPKERDCGDWDQWDQRSCSQETKKTYYYHDRNEPDVLIGTVDRYSVRGVRETR